MLCFAAKGWVSANDVFLITQSWDSQVETSNYQEATEYRTNYIFDFGVIDFQPICKDYFQRIKVFFQT